MPIGNEELASDFHGRGVFQERADAMERWPPENPTFLYSKTESADPNVAMAADLLI